MNEEKVLKDWIDKVDTSLPMECPPDWCPAKEKEWGPDHCTGKDPNCGLCKLEKEANA